MGFVAYNAALLSLNQCSTLDQMRVWRTAYETSVIEYPNTYTYQENQLLDKAYKDRLSEMTGDPSPVITLTQKSGKDAVLDDLSGLDGMTLEDVQKLLSNEKYNQLFTTTDPIVRKQLLADAYFMWKHADEQNTAHKANPEVSKPHLSLFGNGSIAAQIEKQTGEAADQWVKSHTIKPPGQGGNVIDPQPKNKTSVTPPAESQDPVAPILGIGDVIFIAAGIAVAVFIFHAIIAH